MRLLDSRRLTGSNLLLDGPGAVLEVTAEPPEPAIAAWHEALSRLLEALGWAGAATAARVNRKGASLAFAADLDVLYAATEVNEAAWAMATRVLGAPRNGSDESFAATVA